MKMNMNKYIKFIWLSFLFCFFFRLLFILSINTLSIAGDELFSYWPAAKLLGYDWSGLAESYRYYGFGYTILLIPFMALINDPIILYKVMVLMMVLAQSCVAPISFHLMKKYFKIENIKILLLGSIACSFMVSIRAVYTYPEFIYDLLVWLVVWVMLKLMNCKDDKKQGGLYSLLLIFLIAYSLSVHTRGITLLLALIVTYIVYYWIYKERIGSLLIYVGLSVLVYGGVKLVVSCLLSYLDLKVQLNVGNTSAFMAYNFIDLIKDPHSWTAWLSIIIGQLNESIINTGGLAAGIVIVFLVLLWNLIFKKKSGISLFDNKQYVWVSLFCIVSIAITIGGQSIQGLPQTTLAMYYDGDPDGLRQITYFRYYAAYIGPLLMIGIAYFYHHNELFEWVKYKSIVLILILHGYWIFCIVPYIYNYSGTVWSYASYSLTKGFVDPIRIRTYLVGTCFLVLFILLTMAFIKRKKYILVLWLLNAILIYNYGFNALYHEGYRSKINYESTLQGINYLSEIDKQTDLEKVYIQNYYIPNSGQGVQFVFQYNLKDITFISSDSFENMDETVFICYTPKEYKALFSQGFQLFRISQNEYAYVKGDKYCDLSKKYGLKIIDEKEVV